MGTVTGQNITDRAWDTLQDTANGGGVRWTSAKVLTSINDGQREIVTILPPAYTKTSKPTLAAGSRQDFSGLSISDGIQLIKVVRNFDSSGSTPGRAITRIEQAILDAENPTWHSDTGSEVIHYTFDPQDPKAFYIWPTVTNKKAEIVYSALPADLASLASAITLDDIYANALVYYVMFRALMKRLPNSAGSRQEAMGYYNLMLQSLGVKENASLRTDAMQKAAEAAA